MELLYVERFNNLTGSVTKNGNTPTHILSLLHDPSILAQYIKNNQNTDFSISNQDELTPFLYTVKYGSANAVLILLNQDINIYDKDINGNNALHLASDNLDLSILLILLDYIPDDILIELLDQINNDNYTPLFKILGITHSELEHPGKVSILMRDISTYSLIYFTPFYIRMTELGYVFPEFLLPSHFVLLLININSNLNFLA